MKNYLTCRECDKPKCWCKIQHYFVPCLLSPSPNTALVQGCTLNADYRMF